MKKEYTSPEIVVASYSSEDIITASTLTKEKTQSSFEKTINFKDIKF